LSTSNTCTIPATSSSDPRYTGTRLYAESATWRASSAGGSSTDTANTSSRGVITSAAVFPGKIDDAADDRHLLALAHTFQLALAQQLLDPVARGIGEVERRLRHERPGDSPPDGGERRHEEIHQAQRRQEHRNEPLRPPPRNRAGQHLAHQQDDDARAEHEADESRRERRLLAAEEHAAEEHRERDARSRSGEQALWPLDVHVPRRAGLEPTLHPVAQPDPAHGAHGGARRGEPGD
jgi:hypothetical protein